MPRKKKCDRRKLIYGKRGRPYYKTKTGNKHYCPGVPTDLSRRVIWDCNTRAGPRVPKGKKLRTGPKGGKYYYSACGNKIYCPQRRRARLPPRNPGRRSPPPLGQPAIPALEAF